MHVGGLRARHVPAVEKHEVNGENEMDLMHDASSPFLMGAEQAIKIPPVPLGWRRNRFRKNRTQFESPERGFAKHRVWLIIISTPSFKGCHRSEALIGLGQTTRSTGGDDGCFNPLRECVLPGRCCGTWDLRLLRAASKPNPEYVRVLLRCSIPLP